MGLKKTKILGIEKKKHYWNGKEVDVLKCENPNYKDEAEQRIAHDSLIQNYTKRTGKTYTWPFQKISYRKHIYLTCPYYITKVA